MVWLSRSTFRQFPRGANDTFIISRVFQKDIGLVVQLEDMVRDETTHAEETERILRDWPL